MRSWKLLYLLNSMILLAACVPESKGGPDGVVVIGNGAEESIDKKIVVVDVDSERGPETLAVTQQEAKPFLEDQKSRSTPINSTDHSSGNASVRPVTKAPAVEVDWLVVDDVSSYLFKLKKEIPIVEKSEVATATALASGEPSEQVSSCQFFRRYKATGSLFCEKDLDRLESHEGISEPRFMKDRSFYFIDSSKALRYSKQRQSFVVAKGIDQFYLERMGNLVVRTLSGRWKFVAASTLARWNGKDPVAVLDLGADLLVFQTKALEVRLIKMSSEKSPSANQPSTLDWTLLELYQLNSLTEKFEVLPSFKMDPNLRLKSVDFKSVSVFEDRAVFFSTVQGEKTLPSIFEIDSESLKKVVDLEASSESDDSVVETQEQFLFSDSKHIIFVQRRNSPVQVPDSSTSKDSIDASDSSDALSQATLQMKICNLKPGDSQTESAASDPSSWSCANVNFPKGYRTEQVLLENDLLVLGAMKEDSTWVIAYSSPDSPVDSELQVSVEVPVLATRIKNLRRMGISQISQN